MARIKRDTMFIEMAMTVSKRSTCPRANVGALIVKHNRVISMGYNGSEPGEPHCEDTGCLQVHEGGSCSRTIHAEDNAIRFAKELGQSVEGATIYCTHSPCANCAMIIVKSGITTVIFKEWYKAEAGIEILKQCGVGVVWYHVNQR